MDCRKARRLIPRAADGDADELSLARLQGHLASCEDCRRAFDSLCADIHAIKEALNLAAAEVTVRPDFASSVARVAAATCSEGMVRSWSLWNPAARFWTGVTRSRAAAAAAACAAVLGATLLTGLLIGRAVDSSPVASTRISSGHLVTFTVHPGRDGRASADVNAHRYCEVTHAREEGLR